MDDPTDPGDRRHPSWEWWLGEARHYADRTGHGNIPTHTPARNGRRLGRWVDTQRRHYWRDELTFAQVASLEAIPGWSWGTDRTQLWWDTFHALRTWVGARGGRQPTRGGGDPAEHSLAVWAGKQRARHRDGRLPADQAAALSALPGWSWAIATYDWDTRLTAIRSFADQHPGVLLTPTTTGWAWITKARTDYRSGQLEPDLAAALEAVPGWSWDPSDERWAATFDALADWISQHPGHPVRQKDTHRGFALGFWVGTQRRRHRTGRLSAERAAALEQLPGWTWNVRRTTWENHYDAMVASGVDVTNLSRPTTYNDLAIGSWAEAQRARHRAGKLSADRVATLNAVSGWRWTSPRGS